MVIVTLGAYCNKIEMQLVYLSHGQHLGESHLFQLQSAVGMGRGKHLLLGSSRNESKG